MGIRLTGLSGLAVALFALTFLSGYTDQAYLEWIFGLLGLVAFWIFVAMALNIYFSKDYPTAQIS
jgi:hypothetical protein